MRIERLDQLVLHVGVLVEVDLQRLRRIVEGWRVRGVGSECVGRSLAEIAPRLLGARPSTPILHERRLGARVCRGIVGGRVRGRLAGGRIDGALGSLAGCPVSHQFARRRRRGRFFL